MNYVPVESSNIAAVAYDKATLTLGIRFKSGGEYEYFCVQPNVHAAMMSAASVGKFFAGNIKGTYECRKVS